MACGVFTPTPTGIRLRCSVGFSIFEGGGIMDDTWIIDILLIIFLVSVGGKLLCIAVECLCDAFGITEDDDEIWKDGGSDEG